MNLTDKSNKGRHMKAKKTKETIDNSFGISDAYNWSMRHPVQAGIIGVTGLLVARAVGIKKVARFATTSGLANVAMKTFKAASSN